MERELLSIGELARASGLTVSALRFYDGAGVLAPVAVDPHTGYRWYARDQLAPARLVAGLRRVGMPLPEIAAAVRHWGDTGAVAELLAAHLRRLEEGLADAKREISRLRSLFTDEESRMSTIRLTISRDEFAAALATVRFAVGADPELPMLHGVLVESTPGRGPAGRHRPVPARRRRGRRPTWRVTAAGTCCRPVSSTAPRGCSPAAGRSRSR